MSTLDTMLLLIMQLEQLKYNTHSISNSQSLSTDPVELQCPQYSNPLVNMKQLLAHLPRFAQYQPQVNSNGAQILHAQSTQFQIST